MLAGLKFSLAAVTARNFLMKYLTAIPSSPLTSRLVHLSNVCTIFCSYFIYVLVVRQTNSASLAILLCWWVEQLSGWVVVVVHGVSIFAVTDLCQQDHRYLFHNTILIDHLIL